jgi:hypothetical protein
MHNLDFRIRILDLITDWPVEQFAFNIFNPQSKINITPTLQFLISNTANGQKMRFYKPVLGRVIVKVLPWFD